MREGCAAARGGHPVYPVHPVKRQRVGGMKLLRGALILSILFILSQ